MRVRHDREALSNPAPPGPVGLVRAGTVALARGERSI